MKQLKYLFLVSVSTIFVQFSAHSEGLPANPWNTSQRVNISSAQSADNSVSKISDAAVDIWSNVRNTESFRQWHMPAEQTQSSEKQTDNQQDLLIMLSNLSRVGYKVPSNYQKIVTDMPKKSPNVNKADYEQELRKWKESYNRDVRIWKNKYYRAKNNSINILSNSYDRMLSTIKKSTGVDVNRAINDSVKAFK